jgi:Zn-dependent protease with chaperone function
VFQENELRNSLIHRKESVYFAWTLVFSIMTYIALLFSIIGIVIIVVMMLISYFFHALSMAYIRRNGVRISERQFPDVYEKAVDLAAKMELEKMPHIYVVESMGALNAFATRFFGKNMVVVYSEIFDLSEEEREEELLFVLAHEFAHLKRRHVLVHLLLLPAMYVPFLGEAYLRGCEYTCDRYAAYYVGNFDAAKEALTMLAIGKTLSSKVNQEAYVEQIHEESGFFIWLSEKLSSHPDLPKRINALNNWMNPEQYPLLRDRKKGVVIGIILSIVIGAGLTAAVVGLVAASSTLASYLESSETVMDSDQSPLMQAAIDNDVDKLQELMAGGANLEEGDMNGSTALQFAVMWGNVEAAELLLAGGAEVNTVDHWGLTPLMNAVYSGSSMEMSQLLLSYGADPAMKDSDGLTAYDYAVDSGDSELQSLLKQ